MMTLIGELGKRLFRLLLIASFVVWSALPSFNHSPQMLETLHEHMEEVAEHGHSHGILEDLLWALHGHDHDEIDHDHSPLVLTASLQSLTAAGLKDWRQPPLDSIRSPSFLIERPPRA